ARPARPPEPSAAVEFGPQAAELLAAAACGAGSPPAAIPPKLQKTHCDFVKKAQDQYRERWITPARAFFAQHVPADVPKKVVYPFAGGDLSTALTVYPDADEITTLSLEPAGDPRSLRALPRGALGPAMEQVRKELRFLYVVNFSNTKNMIEAMRGGRLPAQLIFGLSALHLHGFELVGLRYFAINDDGSMRYLAQADVDAAGDPSKADAGRRNRIFNNIEIQFRKPGSGRVQVYRHIEANLDDNHLNKDPRVLRHLEAKGQVAGMTKAASYLLSWDAFSKIRGYLLGHVRWMVSDATGVAPKWGRSAGFEYELWGTYEDAHMEAGRSIATEWRKEWAASPQRVLPFRFGYPDRKQRNHLVIMRRAGTPAAK
ncbi:MAG TPA: hypothetical protein PKU97_09285, partial [Kofleriaceae bacterium]|nr:hypothetical protein [Kofleriaceae bacterium]